MKGSKEEASNFTIKPQSELSNEVSKLSEKKDGKEGDNKNGKFGGVFDHIAEQIEKNNANPENDKITKVLIGIKNSALKNASKAKADGSMKVPAEKITTYESGREERETIEIDMSPEQAQGLIDEAEQSKGNGVKDQINNMATDAMKNMMKSVIDNLSGKIAGGEDNQQNGPGSAVASERALETKQQER